MELSARSKRSHICARVAEPSTRIGALRRMRRRLYLAAEILHQVPEGVCGRVGDARQHSAARDIAAILDEISWSIGQSGPRPSALEHGQASSVCVLEIRRPGRFGLGWGQKLGIQTLLRAAQHEPMRWNTISAKYAPDPKAAR